MMKFAAVALSLVQVVASASTDINVKYTFPLTSAMSKARDSGNAFYAEMQKELDNQASLLAQLSAKASFVQGPQSTSGDLSAAVSDVIDAANHIMQPGQAVGTTEALSGDMAQTAADASKDAQQAAASMQHASFVQSGPSDLHAFVEQAFNTVHSIENKVKAEQTALTSALSKKSGGFPALEAQANACNYMRMGATLAYENVNKVVHAVGRTIAKMCGCILVSKVAVCALDKVAEVCNYPYQAYANLWSSSANLWEAVKSTTSQCKIVGHPSVASHR